jgi:hypothetical protein
MVHDLGEAALTIYGAGTASGFILAWLLCKGQRRARRLMEGRAVEPHEDAIRSGRRW